MKTNITIKRFIQPEILGAISLKHLARFFDTFKQELQGRNLPLPHAMVGTGPYYDAWLEMLARPQTLPDSLVEAILEIEELAQDRPRLQAEVAKAPPSLELNPESLPECLAVQLWMWWRKQGLREGELSVESGAAPVGSDSPPADVAHVSKPQPRLLTPAHFDFCVPRGSARSSFEEERETTSDSAEPETAVRAPVAETPLNSQLPSVSTNANTGTKSIGKISRLPREIREQLNRRLQNEEEPKPLLEWLNGLPEVQAVLTAEFEGRPVTRQNLYDWKQYGFRNWQMRQSTLEFVRTLDEDAGSIIPAGQPQSFAGALTEKLAQWVTLRYAAAAQALSVTDEDPQTELRRLREFCRDIVALRRGDLGAGRLSLEHARLAAEQLKTEAELEERFWEWTKRADVQARLHPHRDPDKIRREVVRMVDRELLGIRHPEEEPTEPIQDPAIMI